MHADLITICIPTYRRPELLREAIRTCFLQDYRPLEILIGDDSGNDSALKVTRSLSLPAGISIRHVIHEQPLRQARNVNWLFNNARGSRCLLLHDDDGLVEGGLDKLVSAWDAEFEVVCVYGKFYISSADGGVLAEETKAHNALYGRIRSATGVQSSPISAGLSQQLPHNGYLVDATTARAVQYRTEEEIGNSGDVDFGIRLGFAAGSRKFIFVDDFISFYRQTPNSVLRSRRGIYGWCLLYRAVEQLTLPEADLPARDLLLQRLSAQSIVDAAKAGDRRQALKILWSKHYRLRWHDPRTSFRLAYILFPSLGNAFNLMRSASR